jgi:hypothetical protein
MATMCRRGRDVEYPDRRTNRDTETGCDQLATSLTDVAAHSGEFQDRLSHELKKELDGSLVPHCGERCVEVNFIWCELPDDRWNGCIVRTERGVVVEHHERNVAIFSHHPAAPSEIRDVLRTIRAHLEAMGELGCCDLIQKIGDHVCICISRCDKNSIERRHGHTSHRCEHSHARPCPTRRNASDKALSRLQ